MPANLIEQYLTAIAETRGTHSNVAETSFYPALEHLLTEIGKTLSPRVRCVINLANRGAGIPDGGLFTADQFRRQARDPETASNPFLAQPPARGVIEAKPPSTNVSAIVATEQVEKYWKHYGMVLVTNFRAFALVGHSPDGQPRVLESFELAPTEADFWKLTAHPRKTAEEQGERMLEYLKRVLLHNAPLAAPQDVAGLLASYAHDARLRVERADIPALASLRQALEDALGLRFEGEKGEHFFRSTLVQTLFYGVFSAWVLWSRQRAKPATPTSFASAVREAPSPYGVAGAFDWRSAHFLLRVPMLRALFVQVADPARLGALGLIEVLDWAAAALNRVDRTAFFSSFDEGHAVQYFYEPFLSAFDPDLRKELGVWYTPEEIVRYQVERVDAVLRSELGLADGLADPQVVVLDPCCGTGAYLRAVLRRIAATLHEKGGDALVAHDLKHAAMERVFGFEILPAPFVIAHLQIGLELETLGAPLNDRTDPPERAGVYLTNALTGWEPPKEKPKQIAFPGFDEERDAAGKVKHDKPILVILGNPPYNAFAGVSPQEEQGLVEPYKQGLSTEWGIKKYNLDDLYIRFFRLAEKRVAEHGGRGVVSFISNHSWVSEPSFVVMRRHLLDSFDRFWIENMHGNRKISEYAPDGRTSETAFAIPGFSVGIQQGVAISLWVKHGGPRAVVAAKKKDANPIVRFRDDLNDAKAIERRTHLLDTLVSKKFDEAYETAAPAANNRWSFRPADVTRAYMTWSKLTELCAEDPISGYKENRGFAMLCESKEELEQRMRLYFSATCTWDQFSLTGTSLSIDAARYDARSTWEKIRQIESFNTQRIFRYALRPFELRWAYYSAVRPLWNEPRPSLFKHHGVTSKYLTCRSVWASDPEGTPFFFTKCMGDFHHLRGQAHHFPLALKKECIQQENTLPGLGDGIEHVTANLSPLARAYLAKLGLPNPDADPATAELIWYHALAIGYSPAYLTENADGIRQDWPRIPLPAEKAALLASAELGRRVAALLDTETPVPGVTTGKIREELRSIAVFKRVDGKPANPDAGDLDVTAGWGHAGKGGVTMPGRGRLRKVEGEPPAYDVFLNDAAYWSNIPEAVWDYTIGGYQVIKKWLSYREKPLLGRGLTPDEVRHVTDTARRLAALVAMQGELDRNYRKMAGESFRQG